MVLSSYSGVAVVDQAEFSSMLFMRILIVLLAN